MRLKDLQRGFEQGLRPGNPQRWQPALKSVSDTYLQQERDLRVVVTVVWKLLPGEDVSDTEPLDPTLVLAVD